MIPAVKPLLPRAPQRPSHPQIDGLFQLSIVKLKRYAIALITIKVLDARRRGAIEGNAADDALMADHGRRYRIV
jgi:hypothetical protein